MVEGYYLSLVLNSTGMGPDLIAALKLIEINYRRFGDWLGHILLACLYHIYFSMVAICPVAWRAS